MARPWPLSAAIMTNYRARIERSNPGGLNIIYAVNIFFRDDNIIEAAKSIEQFALTSGFATDTVKQIVEIDDKNAIQVEEAKPIPYSPMRGNRRI